VKTSFFHTPLNLLFIAAILILPAGLNAQQTQNKNIENKFRAVHWTIYDGISQGENYFMIKDASGFLWIGSKHGLNRFDGNIIKIYYHDPHNKRTIAGNLISGFIEDSLHNIWIGTEMGLSRYDIKADTFSNFPPAKDVDPDHPSIPFWATKDKVFAFEGYHITVYNIYSFRKKEVDALTDEDGFGFGPSDQYAIFDAASNGIWMLHGSYHGAAAGLLNISLSDGKKQYFTWPCFLHIPNHDHSSEAIHYDRKRNAIWINSPDGLMEFTLADKRFHHIDALNDLLKLKDYRRFVGVDLDLQGRVWLATAPKGILIYDPLDQSLSVPFPEDTVLQHDVSDANAVIYCDKEGMTWLGTWLRKGFYQIIPYAPAVKLYTPNPKRPPGFSENAVFTIAKARSGVLWIGTQQGLFEFNKQTGAFKALSDKDFPGLKVNKFIITAIVDPVLNKAWMVNGECFEMDMKTQICRPVIFKDSLGKSLTPDGITSILPLKNNWIVAGPYKGKEIIFMGSNDNITAREGISVPNNSINPFYTTTDHDHLLFIKQDGWAGNITVGYLHGKFMRIHHKMDSLQWKSIFFNEKDRTYWVAGEGKLLHYSKDFKMIHTYTQADGLPDLEITSLIADNNGNIWFHTDRSVHQLNITTGEISTLTENDGFEKQNFGLVMSGNYKDDNGDIYFAGAVFGSGFDRIVPGKYTNPSSSMYLQSLEVNQKPFPLPTGVNSLKELSLRYNENKITIETGIIDYYSKGASRMRYKLEGKGVNENWQFGPANYTIRFEGLQPGKYKLRMQASNAALQFNGPEKTLVILISPPWYGTWWFRIIIIAIASYIVISIFRARVKKIKDDARIENQLKELEMKALKAQMNPHFIYNALNSIQALVANDKKAEGIHYIGSFSRLLRQVLDNSENNVISLDKELETIDLYIQLESLRLDMQLHYKKIVPENVVTEFEKIPPLILQPFVENALWHGLSRKEGEKEVKIIVSLKDDWLLCDITDNGIGREKAQELKNNSISIHQSKAIDITRKRLIDFNGVDSASPIEFFDLYDHCQNPSGTRVILHIKRKNSLASV
jgi:ligand-binding sensor domain-containing protein